MGFLYKMSKYQMNIYEIREVMAVFGFVQKYANCAQLCDKLEFQLWTVQIELLEAKSDMTAEIIRTNT